MAVEAFGVGQATASRSIDRIAPAVRQCVQIPARIHDRAKRASTLEELEEILPGLRCLIDASEQQVQRPKRKDMEKSHYSGKAGRHTAKVRYTVNTNGLIVHSTRHSPWRVHDIRACRMRHRRFPPACRPGAGLTARRGRQRCGPIWAGAARVRRRCAKGWKCWRRQAEARKKALGAQKRRSTGCTQDPCLRGTRRPEGQDLADNGRGVPEPAEEARPDQRCHVRIGKPKAAVAGRTGSLTETGLKSRVGRLEK